MRSVAQAATTVSGHLVVTTFLFASVATKVLRGILEGDKQRVALCGRPCVETQCGKPGVATEGHPYSCFLVID